MANSINAVYAIIIALAVNKLRATCAAPAISTLPLSAADNCPVAVNAETEPVVLQKYVKCLATDMGLWTDEEGFNAQKIAELFAKQQMSEEIIVVVNYCNQSHRDENDLPKWAFDAYKCATSGRMGDWVKEHVRAVYGEKSIL